MSGGIATGEVFDPSGYFLESLVRQVDLLQPLELFDGLYLAFEAVLWGFGQKLVLGTREMTRRMGTYGRGGNRAVLQQSDDALRVLPKRTQLDWTLDHRRRKNVNNATPLAWDVATRMLFYSTRGSSMYLLPIEKEEIPPSVSVHCKRKENALMRKGGRTIATPIS